MNTDDIRALHVDDQFHDYPVCAECGQAWPCDAVRAVDEIDRLNSRAEALSASVEADNNFHADKLNEAETARLAAQDSANKWSADALKAEAAIARVRELCNRNVRMWSHLPGVQADWREVLRALEGDQ